MTNWLRVDTVKMAARHQKANRLFLSPYDVPEAVRAYRDGDSIILEFRYIPISERTQLMEFNKDISLEVGENSGRIYKISVDSSRDSRGKEILAELDPIGDAIDKFIADQESLSKRTSIYSAPKDILRDYALQLNKSLGAPNL